MKEAKLYTTAKLLKDNLNLCGLTQHMIADELDVSDSTVTAILNGSRKISIHRTLEFGHLVGLVSDKITYSYIIDYCKEYYSQISVDEPLSPKELLDSAEKLFTKDLDKSRNYIAAVVLDTLGLSTPEDKATAVAMLGHVFCYENRAYDARTCWEAAIGTGKLGQFWLTRCTLGLAAEYITLAKYPQASYLLECLLNESFLCGWRRGYALFLFVELKLITTKIEDLSHKEISDHIAELVLAEELLEERLDMQIWCEGLRGFAMVIKSLITKNGKEGEGFSVLDEAIEKVESKEDGPSWRQPKAYLYMYRVQSVHFCFPNEKMDAQTEVDLCNAEYIARKFRFSNIRQRVQALREGFSQNKE